MNVKIKEPEIGELALTLRWRLSNRSLMIPSRHLNTLKARGFSPHLESWCREHIDWTLAEGTADVPDGVLVIEVDTLSRAVMSAVEFEELPNSQRSVQALYNRAISAVPTLKTLTKKELTPTNRFKTNHLMEIGDRVASEVLWACQSDNLVMFCEKDRKLSGMNSLIFDLAKTLNYPMKYNDLPASINAGVLQQAEEIFLVSDEFGVVSSIEKSGAVTQKFIDAYQKLYEKTADKHKKD